MKITVRTPLEPFGGRYPWVYSITVNNARCKICTKGFQWHKEHEGKRLKEVGICRTCDFWMEKFTIRNEEKVARIDGEHYIIGNQLERELNPLESFNQIFEALEKENAQRPGRGMGGTVHAVKFNDGRVIFTNDLWHQGTVPVEFKEALADNAEFMARA